MIATLFRTLLFMTAFVLGCVAVYERSQEPSGSLPAPVAVVAPEPPEEPRDVAGPGRLEPFSGEIDLAADIAGVLATISVKEGDQVKKGQVLAEFINQDAIARVAQSEARLKMQQAEFAKVMKGARAETRAQAAAATQEQDATLNRLQLELQRQMALFKKKIGSKAQLEEAQSSVAVAKARKASAQQALAELDAGSRSEDVASAEAEVALAQAQLADATATLEKTRIRAPIDGVILRVYRHPGEAVGLIASASAILQIGDIGTLLVRTQIDEADIDRVARGARAYATASAFPGKRFTGTVSDISPRLGAKTIQTGAPTEKRDASVLDVLITLDRGTRLPIGLRVDCFISETADAYELRGSS